MKIDSAFTHTHKVLFPKVPVLFF